MSLACDLKGGRSDDGISSDIASDRARTNRSGRRTVRGLIEGAVSAATTKRITKKMLEKEQLNSVHGKQQKLEGEKGSDIR